MPKIKKDTIKQIPKIHSLKIYKKDTRNNYYCSFYVGTNIMKSGNKEISLKTENVKEALKKARSVYIDWQNENKDVIVNSQRRLDIDKDIATPFFKVRIRKYQMKGKSGTSNQGVREKLRWNNYIIKFFKDIDYNNPELINDAIHNLVNDLREDKKTDNTISKYLNILSLMFKRAHNLGTTKFIPEFPSMNIVNQARTSYFNEELNLINRQLEKEYEKTKDKEYLEIKDYINLIRSAGFRPGIQPLMIKNFQYKFLIDKQNPNEPILQFTLFDTKTAPKHKLTCHPYFTKNIFPEIKNRIDKRSSEDYLLFPNEKNRQKLYNRISKVFVRISKQLDLYYRNGQSRPLYSIRHTFISNRYNSGTSLELLAKTSNTSEKMLRKHYLDNEETMAIEEHKRMFQTKDKSVIKFKKK
ncbi:hypothetical protein OAT00_01235 [Pelagibacteraceae bacterium]|nr:hypothetical protein [Pelagibacteraceae bacterium]